MAYKAGAKSGLGNIAGIIFMAGYISDRFFFLHRADIRNIACECSGGRRMAAYRWRAAGFGLALGLPFALFAMFPNWLQSLPKSGGWMTEVKVVLGFVELALAVKFFSNADLVKQWGLLKRELFIAFWVVIGICIVIYLLTKMIQRKKAGSGFSIIRLLFLLVFAATTIYLIPGLTNTNMRT
ncbi:MAG: hypothetical protein WDN26_04520 [Chitinophagaceae bacterium]